LNRDYAEYQNPSDNFKTKFIKQFPVKNSELIYNV